MAFDQECSDLFGLGGMVEWVTYGVSKSDVSKKERNES
jgi:hypothetical protein